MSFTMSIRQAAGGSLRHIASSSRLTLLHPIPSPLPLAYTARPLSRSICSSQVDRSSATSPLSPTAPRSASVAQHQPASTAAYEAVSAPRYISPVDGSKAGAAKEPRRRPRAQKAAIKMTPAAIAHLQALLSDPSNPKLLRIGVKTRGCAGMAYHLDYVDPPGGKFDEVVEQDGVKVLIDSKALFSIIGSTMDWRDNRLSAGFVFDNPNVVDTCGCGESFNIRV
ncbi:iron ion transport-related protein [Papiliotrema laurentii]|uniref:Iron-sulfur assembly protein 1 n=1 Tax=Papiliotrema laurentii TaxID=5418 RepID=A0AAD9FVL1_PAPLA|nr:iron ion transport-related protein [Papiliotrema laurentii]